MALVQTDLLNKHMSVGFTVPFVQIFRNKPASALEIGLITAMFGKLRLSRQWLHPQGHSSQLELPLMLLSLGS